MSTLSLVILASSFAGLVTIGVIFSLTKNPKIGSLMTTYGTPFGAGILLTAAFFDLLPHGIEEEGSIVLNATLSAIIVFFFLEKIFKNFHHHHEEDIAESNNIGQGWLFLFGEIFHNLIDGLALGAAFLISTQTGYLATLALISHDLPMKLSEFSLQLQSGFSRAQTLRRSIISALVTVLSAVFAFQFASSLDLNMGYLYGSIAGFFIYIALSDIVPTIHSSEEKTVGLQTIFLIVGLLLGYTIATYLHSFIETEESHMHYEESELHDDDNHHDDDDHHDDDNHHDEDVDSKSTSTTVLSNTDSKQGCSTLIDQYKELSVYLVAIEKPFPGEVMSGTFLVTGCSSAFEGTVVWELLDSFGNIVDTYFTNGGSIEMDVFEFEIDTKKYENGKYFLRVMETDPSDGESSLKLDETLLPVYISNP